MTSVQVISYQEGVERSVPPGRPLLPLLEDPGRLAGRLAQPCPPQLGGGQAGGAGGLAQAPRLHHRQVGGAGGQVGGAGGQVGGAGGQVRGAGGQVGGAGG